MFVSKWGNSLAVRLPASVVKVLKLEEGDDIEITVTGNKSFAVEKKPLSTEVISRLRKYRGKMPADFKFDRFETHERS
jgi:antitoxin MazE